jgi:hypothetical protein
MVKLYNGIIDVYYEEIPLGIRPNGHSSPQKGPPLCEYLGLIPGFVSIYIIFAFSGSFGLCRGVWWRFWLVGWGLSVNPSMRMCGVQFRYVLCGLFGERGTYEFLKGRRGRCWILSWSYYVLFLIGCIVVATIVPPILRSF